MEAKLKVLETPTRTTRFQELRYRVTPAGRAREFADPKLNEFILYAECCMNVSEWGHAPNCKGTSIGDMKKELRETEKRYLEHVNEGGEVFPHWKEKAKMHNEICSKIDYYIKLLSSPRDGGPFIERVA